MITHLDGTESPAYAESLPLLPHEADINRNHFWTNPEAPEGVRDYAVTMTWDPKAKDVAFAVGRRNDPEADVPLEIQLWASVVMERYIQLLNDSAAAR
jgi:hypothetical protein